MQRTDHWIKANLSPPGMHKHFRILSLATHLRNHGYNSPHTQIPGIWSKLRTLYNLEALDAAEDRLDFGALDDADPEDDVELGYMRDQNGVWREFELPEAEFGEMCFLRGKRRSDSETPSSPAHLDEPLEEPALPVAGTARKRKTREQPLGTRESTVDSTSATGTSPPPQGVRGSVPGAGLGRGRGRGRGGARGATLNLQRSSVDRGASRDTENGQETTEHDTATGEDEDETQEEEEEEDTEEGSPSPRQSKRGRGGGRGASLRGRGKRGKKRGGRGG